MAREGQYRFEYQQIGSFLGIPRWRATINIVDSCLSATEYFTCSEKRLRNKIAKQIKKLRKRDWYEREGRRGGSFD